MERPHLTLLSYFILLLIVVTGANAATASTHLERLGRTTTPAAASFTPVAPHIAAKAYISIDVNSGKVLAQKNIDQKLPPASLTKLMTLYVVSSALKSGQIKLSDQVRISKKAWKMPGSKMFVREGQLVTVEDLVKGIIVASGNDASVAMAEYVAGSEVNFVKLMNQQASALGMTNTHFTDSTGLPHKDLYTTAKDLAILARAIVKDFPEYYPWYSQKWFTFNKIKQPNRNRLLWRVPNVDGIKTGHTDTAGYCLIASAKKGPMRILSVILGAPSDAARADSGQRLLTFGFRFFETHNLYQKLVKIIDTPVWKGQQNSVALGTQHNVVLTIPKGQYPHLKVITEITNRLQAPITSGQNVGNLVIKLNDKVIAKYPLVTLTSVKKGSFFTQIKDNIVLSMSKLTGS